MGRYQTWALSFLLGSFALCLLSLFQKLAAGYPLFLQGFVVPFWAGGCFGLLIGIRQYRLEEARDALQKAYNESELKVQKRTTELRLSEEKFRSMYESSAVGIAKVSLDYKIEQANKAYCQMLGYDEIELIGKTLNEITFPEDILENIEKQNKLGIGEIEFYQMEKRFVHKDDRIICGILSANLIRNESGEPWYFLGTVIDITKRKLAEHALQLEHTRIINILDAIPDGIYIVSQQCDIEYINPTIKREFGPVKNRKCYEYFHNRTEICPWCKNAEVFAGKSVQWEWYSSKNNRHYVLFDMPFKNADGSISKFGIFHDITVRKQLEERLRRSQKMETVGILAGGIAHEFNNLLYIISGNTELILDDFEEGCKIDTYCESCDKYEMLKEITKSTQRGANLVKQLMAFSRKAESNLTITCLNTEIHKIKKMLDRILPRMIEIKLDFSDNLHPLKTDQGQIEQVVTNLCLNARDAMPDGGTITIKTENDVIGKTFVDMHPGKPIGLKEGKCVILTISDTGFGMDEKTKEHIFDPFFTTKEVGSGTGLGLSVIYGIIEGHNGDISCYSELGVGTTFRIYFPAIDDDQTVLTSDKDTAEPSSSKGNGTILIVDDEESIIKMTEKMFERLGYKIITAFSGESALDIYTKKQKEIDLIVLDLGMPGMGGKRCLEKLIEFDPDVKVIIVSGYSNEGLVQDNINAGAKDFAIKPFSKENISKVIREVLDKR